MGFVVFAAQTARGVFERRPEDIPRLTPVGGVSVCLGGLVADADDVRASRAIEQCRERLSEDTADHRPVFPDVQLLEKSLVDLPPDLVGGAQVGRRALLSSVERFAERLLDVGGSGLGAPDLVVGFGQLPSESLHLSREQILRDGAGVVGAEQLLKFVLGLFLLAERPLEVVAGFVLLLG
ncbi:hypothetical protein [Amycolatopsis sp. lyj-109]|uniref:hypothetical protein n=1 Tax=Amycolatopsis sp. lyj-109 TaxID=2789287 RepID=UPI003977FEB1